MIFSFFVILLLISVFFSRKFSVTTNKNTLIEFDSNLVIGLVFIFLFLFPYWILGSASAFGGYDEYHGQITWFWLKDNYGEESFVHSYLGGIGIKDSFNSGNEYFSLYGILLKVFPQFIAGLFYKFTTLFITYFGLYITAKKGFMLRNEVSFVVSIFTLSLGYVNYQFSLGGNGMMIAILSLTYPIFFLKKNNLEKYIFCSLFLLLVVFCTNPLTFIPVFIFNYLAILLVFYEGEKLLKLKKDLLLVFTGCFLSLLNWFESFLILFQIMEESARVQLTTQENLYGLFKEFIQEIYFFFRKEPHPSFLAIFALFMIKGMEFKKKLIYSCFLIFFVPLLLQLVSFILDIPLVKNYRWPQVFYILEVFSGLLLMYVLSQNIHKMKYYSIYLIMIPISAYGLSINTMNILEIRENQGGYNTRSDFKILKDLVDDDKEYRVISLAYTPPPMMPLHYGLDTYDGAVTHASIQRTDFIEKMILNGGKIHNHRQIFLSENSLDLKALSLVNVKYILSSSPISKEGLKLHSHQSEILFNFDFLPEKIANLIQENFFNKYLNGLHIYEIKEQIFPRFYPANNLILKNKKNGKDDYLALKSLKVGDALIESYPNLNKHFSIPKSDNALKIINYELTNNGYNFTLAGEGLLVINNIFKDNWSFTCGQERMNIYPTNEVMMGVFITKDCNKGTFIYDQNY